MSDKSKHCLILSVNAGSSSLKISAFSPIPENELSNFDQSSFYEPVHLLLTASFENLTSPPALFTFRAESEEISTESRKNENVEGVTDHESAFNHFLDFLQQSTKFDRKDISKICHRVVHGGDYEKPVVISNESYHHIESLSDLAPLHNDRALAVIKSCINILPNTTSIAFFDSMFHSTIPDYARRYAINPEVAEAKGLKKYGFHGLSYSYILRQVASHLQKPIADISVIVMHLGSGASVCAIKKGESLDTSMGLTPLDGLPGATRSGSVDPSMIFHYRASGSDGEDNVVRISRKAAGEVHITDAEEILNKHSGWKSITGTTDFRVITTSIFPQNTLPNSYYPASSSTHPYHALAFNILVDRILTYVGSYFLKLGGSAAVDAIVFSGGIGERSVELRAAVGERCYCLGVEVERKLNEGVSSEKGSVVEIGKGAVKTLVCRTDEQLEMARQCLLGEDFSR